MNRTQKINRARTRHGLAPMLGMEPWTEFYTARPKANLFRGWYFEADHTLEAKRRMRETFDIAAVLP